MPQPKKPAAGKPSPADAARAEAADGRIPVESHGLTLTVPAKIPFALMRHLHGGLDLTGVVGVMQELLGPEQMETVWAAGLDMDEGAALVGDLLQAAGVTPGE